MVRLGRQIITEPRIAFEGSATFDQTAGVFADVDVSSPVCSQDDLAAVIAEINPIVNTPSVVTAWLSQSRGLTNVSNFSTPAAEQLKKLVDSVQLTISPDQLRKLTEPAQFSTPAAEQLKKLVDSVQLTISPDQLRKLTEPAQFSTPAAEQLKKLVDSVQLTISPDQLRKLTEPPSLVLDQEPQPSPEVSIDPESSDDPSASEAAEDDDDV